MLDLANPKVGDNQVLPTAERDIARLEIIHEVYRSAGERTMLSAGIAQGSRVADIGCGTALCIFMASG